MFGLGFTEVLVICVVALIVFGPERLPGMARTLGQSMAQFRRAVDEFKYELMSSDGTPAKNSSPRVADLTTPSENHANCEQVGTAAASNPEGEKKVPLALRSEKDLSH